MNSRFCLKIALVLAAMIQAMAACAGDDYKEQRRIMVERDLKARGISDESVLAAMGKVERHLFVPGFLRGSAYGDHPLPIGEGQTISQPYVVALMTQAVRPRAGDRVLEIGTGSGYQAAVLAEITEAVYTIEIVEKLAESASRRLSSLGYKNVHVKAGDGFFGWPEHAPFDAIIVTAAAERIPERLLNQLKPGGRLIMPVGPQSTGQRLTLVTRDKDGSLKYHVREGVRFVPMTGRVLEKPNIKQ
jgi:protein-L-isoaspartate(D-aspartate) O-methyltransferase